LDLPFFWGGLTRGFNRVIHIPKKVKKSKKGLAIYTYMVYDRFIK